MLQETSETTWTRPGSAPETDAAGNLYDDAVPVQTKPAVSDSMRQKMINESRGLGADPNQKNPFLPVFFGVGVFVLLGAIAVNI